MRPIELFSKLPLNMQVKLATMYMKYQFKNNIHVEVSGEENFKKITGPCIFISNHLSNIDGLILTKVLKEKYNPYFVAGIKLSSNNLTNFFKSMVRTINIKPNTADIESMKKIVNAVKEGENLVIFPEGTRSRTASLIEPKKGILLIAKLTKAQIVPISMMGNEKVLPISQDEDMSKEKFRKGKVEVIIGEPFYLDPKTKEEGKDEYEERSLTQLMVAIAKNLREEYRGIYKDKI